MNKWKDFEKVKKVINSCVNLDQLKIAQKMYQQFKDKHYKSHTEILELHKIYLKKDSELYMEEIKKGRYEYPNKLRWDNHNYELPIEEDENKMKRFKDFLNEEFIGIENDCSADAFNELNERMFSNDFTKEELEFMFNHLESSFRGYIYNPEEYKPELQNSILKKLKNKII